jgi:hypothetical protein
MMKQSMKTPNKQIRAKIAILMKLPDSSAMDRYSQDRMARATCTKVARAVAIDAAAAITAGCDVCPLPFTAADLAGETSDSTASS